MHDIRGKEDLTILVNEFYKLVRSDDLIGPIFNGMISSSEWPMHLDKMVNFWDSVLFSGTEYRGNPFSHHIGLGIKKIHFDRWTTFLQKVISENFNGKKADEALDRANKMRLMFEAKLKDIEDNPDKYPIM